MTEAEFKTAERKCYHDLLDRALDADKALFSVDVEKGLISLEFSIKEKVRLNAWQLSRTNVIKWTNRLLFNFIKNKGSKQAWKRQR